MEKELIDRIAESLYQAYQKGNAEPSRKWRHLESVDRSKWRLIARAGLDAMANGGGAEQSRRTDVNSGFSPTKADYG